MWHALGGNAPNEHKRGHERKRQTTDCDVDDDQPDEAYHDEQEQRLFDEAAMRLRAHINRADCPRCLLVMSNPLLRSTTRLMLMKIGMAVDEATDGRDFASKWDSLHAQFDLVLIDVMTTELDMVDLIRIITQQRHEEIKFGATAFPCAIVALLGPSPHDTWIRARPSLLPYINDQAGYDEHHEQVSPTLVLEMGFDLFIRRPLTMRRLNLLAEIFITSMGRVPEDIKHSKANYLQIRSILIEMSDRALSNVLRDRGDGTDAKLLAEHPLMQLRIEKHPLFVRMRDESKDKEKELLDISEQMIHTNHELHELRKEITKLKAELDRSKTEMSTARVDLAAKEKELLDLQRLDMNNRVQFAKREEKWMRVNEQLKNRLRDIEDRERQRQQLNEQRRKEGVADMPQSVAPSIDELPPLAPLDIPATTDTDGEASDEPLTPGDSVTLQKTKSKTGPTFHSASRTTKLDERKRLSAKVKELSKLKKRLNVRVAYGRQALALVEQEMMALHDVDMVSGPRTLNMVLGCLDGKDTDLDTSLVASRLPEAVVYIPVTDEPKNQPTAPDANEDVKSLKKLLQSSSYREELADVVLLYRRIFEAPKQNVEHAAKLIRSLQDSLESLEYDDTQRKILISVDAVVKDLRQSLVHLQATKAKDLVRCVQSILGREQQVRATNSASLSALRQSVSWERKKSHATQRQMSIVSTHSKPDTTRRHAQKPKRGRNRSVAPQLSESVDHSGTDGDETDESKRGRTPSNNVLSIPIPELPLQDRPVSASSVQISVEGSPASPKQESEWKEKDSNSRAKQGRSLSSYTPRQPTQGVVITPAVKHKSHSSLVPPSPTTEQKQLKAETAVRQGGPERVVPHAVQRPKMLPEPPRVTLDRATPVPETTEQKPVRHHRRLIPELPAPRRSGVESVPTSAPHSVVSSTETLPSSRATPQASPLESSSPALPATQSIEVFTFPEEAPGVTTPPKHQGNPSRVSVTLPVDEAPGLLLLDTPVREQLGKIVNHETEPAEGVPTPRHPTAAYVEEKTEPVQIIPMQPSQYKGKEQAVAGQPAVQVDFQHNRSPPPEQALKELDQTEKRIRFAQTHPAAPEQTPKPTTTGTMPGRVQPLNAEKPPVSGASKSPPPAPWESSFSQIAPAASMVHDGEEAHAMSVAAPEGMKPQGLIASLQVLERANGHQAKQRASLADMPFMHATYTAISDIPDLQQREPSEQSDEAEPPRTRARIQEESVLILPPGLRHNRMSQTPAEWALSIPASDKSAAMPESAQAKLRKEVNYLRQRSKIAIENSLQLRHQLVRLHRTVVDLLHQLSTSLPSLRHLAVRDLIGHLNPDGDSGSDGEDEAHGGTGKRRRSPLHNVDYTLLVQEDRANVQQFLDFLQSVQLNPVGAVREVPSEGPSQTEIDSAPRMLQRHLQSPPRQTTGSIADYDPRSAIVPPFFRALKSVLVNYGECLEFTREGAEAAQVAGDVLVYLGTDANKVALTQAERAEDAAGTAAVADLARRTLKATVREAGAKAAEAAQARAHADATTEALAAAMAAKEACLAVATAVQKAQRTAARAVQSAERAAMVIPPSVAQRIVSDYPQPLVCLRRLAATPEEKIQPNTGPGAISTSPDTLVPLPPLPIQKQDNPRRGMHNKPGTDGSQSLREALSNRNKPQKSNKDTTPRLMLGPSLTYVPTVDSDKDMPAPSLAHPSLAPRSSVTFPAIYPPTSPIPNDVR